MDKDCWASRTPLLRIHAPAALGLPVRHQPNLLAEIPTRCWDFIPAYLTYPPTKRFNHRQQQMNSLLTLVGWLILLVLCWPLALLALILWPLVWLISLPFRLVGITFEALFVLLRAVLMLPARVLGYKGKT